MKKLSILKSGQRERKKLISSRAVLHSEPFLSEGFSVIHHAGKGGEGEMTPTGFNTASRASREANIIWY